MQQQQQEVTMRTNKAEGFGGHIGREGLVGARRPGKLRRVASRERFFESLDDG